MSLLQACRSGGPISPPSQFAKFAPDCYLKSRAFERRVSTRSRYEYRRALARIEDIPTSTGATVAMLPITSITPAAVDKIYTKLQTGPRGHRVRQANLSIDIA